MAVRQETGLGQFPKQQSERKKGFLSTVQGRVAAGVVAGTIAFGSFAVYEANQNSNEPGSTPIPGGIIEPSNSSIPTPFLTENPTVTISPSPEVSPTPTPSVEPTPTPTPEATIPPIEEVKLTYPGNAEMKMFEYKPYYFLSLDKATVTAIEPAENNTLWFAVTIAGNKINVDCKTKNVNIPINTVEFCSFKGATLWIKIDKNTGAWDTSPHFPLIGYGSKNIEPYLKVGDKIDNVGIFFGNHPRIPMTSKDTRMNFNSLAKLKASDGKTYPRSDKRFSFYATGVNLNTPIY